MTTLTPSVPERHRRETWRGHRTRRRRRPLLRALVGPCLLVVSLGLTTGSGNALVQSGVKPLPGVTTAEQGAARTGSPAVGAHLMAKHHCWSDEAPAEWAGVLPAAAVVIPAGNDEAVHGSEWVGPALEHIFEGTRPDLTVLGFCPG